MVEKSVDNIEVYYQLKLLNLTQTPKIYKIDDVSKIIIYEYIEGKTLYELINNETIEQETLIAIGLKLINAVKIINENNIIHKDIKQENIICGDNGEVYIIDFGVSRLFDGQKSRDTRLFGTHDYASPEHYGYKETTFKSDMYSLGMVLKDLKLPIEFNRVIERCTEINPNDRYSNYEQVITDYENAFKKMNRLNVKDALISILSKVKENTTKQYKGEDESFIEVLFNWRYNFDNSKIQWMITLLIFILTCYAIYIDKALRKESLIVLIIVGFFCLVLISYAIDTIRVTIKKLFNKKIRLIKYLLVEMLVLFIIFIICFIVVFVSQL